MIDYTLSPGFYCIPLSQYLIITVSSSPFPDNLVLPDGAGRVPDGDAVGVHLGLGEGGERPPPQGGPPQRERRGRHRA